MLWIGAVQNGRIEGEWEECLYWKRDEKAACMTGLFLSNIIISKEINTAS